MSTTDKTLEDAIETRDRLRSLTEKWQDARAALEAARIERDAALYGALHEEGYTWKQVMAWSGVTSPTGISQSIDRHERRMKGEQGDDA